MLIFVKQTNKKKANPSIGSAPLSKKMHSEV